MDSIKKLTDLFAEFPTVGKRTASRFVFHLIRQPKEKIDELTAAIDILKKNVKLCVLCFNPHENADNLCLICQNPARNKKIICIVKKEADLLSIENTKKYQGLYFIMGGVTEFPKNTDDIRLDKLKERIGQSNLEEIIIALNPTPEGKATSVLIEQTIKQLSVASPQSFKITYLARGLPFGGELEYADQETLGSAFEGRK